MAEPLVTNMMDDLVELLKYEMPDLAGRIVYGPPESTPAALCIWIEYGPVEIEYGLMEVATHSCRIVVATPRQGNYPSEYQTVNTYGQAVHFALKGEIILATDAVVTSMFINPAGGAGYAGQPDVLVTQVIDITIETKQDTAGENL